MTQTQLRRGHLYRLHHRVFLAVHSPYCDDPTCQCSGWYLLGPRARRRLQRRGGFAIDGRDVLGVQLDGEIGEIDHGLWLGPGDSLRDLVPVTSDGGDQDQEAMA